MTARKPVERDFMGYIRVSKIAGRGGTTFHSPEMQLDTVKDGIKRAGGRFVGYKEDPDRSGYQNITREGWDAAVEWLMEDPRNRGIAAYDTSRLSRNLWKLLGDIQHRIVPAGGRVIVPGDGIDTDEEGWQDKIQMLGMFAERYSREIGKKWSTVLAKRAAAGQQPTGQAIYGYLKVPDPDDPKGRGTVLVPDEDGGTAEVVRRMYRLYNGGTGLREIAKILNEDGVPSPKGGEWGIATVTRTLQKKAYVGVLTYRSKDTGDVVEYPAGWEPLISDATREAYEAERRRRSKAPKRAQVAKWTLGGGLSVCGHCGAALITNSTLSHNGQVICGNYRNGRRCPGGGVFILRRTLETTFTYMLGVWLEEIGKTVSARYDAEAARVRGEAEAAIRRAEERQEQVKAARLRLVKQNGEGLITDADLRDALAEYAAESVALSDAVAEARARMDAAAPMGDVYERLEAGGEDMTASEWSRTLAKVVRRVELHDDRIVFVPVVGEDDRAQWRTVERTRKAGKRRRQYAVREEWAEPAC